MPLTSRCTTSASSTDSLWLPISRARRRPRTRPRARQGVLVLVLLRVPVLRHTCSKIPSITDAAGSARSAGAGRTERVVAAHDLVALAAALPVVMRAAAATLEVVHGDRRRGRGSGQENEREHQDRSERDDEPSKHARTPPTIDGIREGRSRRRRRMRGSPHSLPLAPVLARLVQEHGRTSSPPGHAHFSGARRSRFFQYPG